jgi:hypothetical protein
LLSARVAACSETDREIERLEQHLALARAKKQQLEGEVVSATAVAAQQSVKLADLHTQAATYTGEFDVCSCSEAPLCKFCLAATTGSLIPAMEASKLSALGELTAARAAAHELDARRQEVLEQASARDADLKTIATGLAHNFVGMV